MHDLLPAKFHLLVAAQAIPRELQKSGGWNAVASRKPVELPGEAVTRLPSIADEHFAIAPRENQRGSQPCRPSSDDNCVPKTRAWHSAGSLRMEFAMQYGGCRFPKPPGWRSGPLEQGAKGYADEAATTPAKPGDRARPEPDRSASSSLNCLRSTLN